MNNDLFRNISLKKLSSPEQLDELIKVTSPRAWLVLIAITGILISTLVWGFLGSIPTKIEGQGILLNNGGVFSIEHHTSGRVIDVRFKVGDRVKAGDVVARIELPELVDRINSLLDDLKNKEDNKQTGLPEYKTIERQVIRLREELDYKSKIVSQVDGRILEINISKGSNIENGQSLITLEQSGGTVKMEAVVFVLAGQGEEILPGMEAQISPTTVNKEEFGYMLGRVTSVSKYPATTQSMMKTLENEKLVSELSGQGASLMVCIDLIPDSNSISGYKWSSPSGPPVSINSGTLVNSTVVVNREKPISKIIPFFSSK